MEGGISPLLANWEPLGIIQWGYGLQLLSGITFGQTIDLIKIT